MNKMELIAEVALKAGLSKKDAEKALKHVGKLMQCLEELDEEGMDERYGSRYGSRMGERDDWDEDDDDEKMPQRMGERRRRSSSGRYM